MKRKAALALAVMFGVSVFTPGTARAATSNFVDNRLNVPGNTLLVESGILHTTQIYNNNRTGRPSDEPRYYTEGTDLVIPLDREVYDGNEFKLTLANAKWFFRSALGHESSSFTANMTSILTSHVTNSFGATTPLATADFHADTMLEANPVPYGITYDPVIGYYAPTSGTTGASGNYYRCTQSGISTSRGNVNYYEVAYKMAVSGLDNGVATVTVLGTDYRPGSLGNGTGWEIRIPLVTLIKNDDVDATVTIDPGNISTITAQKIVFANASKNQTKTTCKEVVVSRDVFDLKEIIISEIRPFTIQGGDIIKLSLPYGYYFDDSNWTADTSRTDRVNVGLEPGLAWADGTTGYGTYIGLWSASARADLDIGGTNHFSMRLGGGNYNDKLNPDTVSSTVNRNEMLIYLPRYLGSSGQLRGNVYITNLRIWADDNVPLPAGGATSDIRMTVSGDNWLDPLTSHITEETVLVAQRVDWALSLKTLTNVPTLVSGRYIGPSIHGDDADNNTHKTARVRLYESTTNSWWARRTTVVSLPATNNNDIKGAKFRKVQVVDADGVSDADKTALKDKWYRSMLYTSSLYSNTTTGASLWPRETEKGVYLNDAERHGFISVDENKITITNLNPTGKSSIDFDLWVSVELGFGKQTGDLKLSIDPASTSLTGAAENYSNVVIAHIVDPITVTTKVSDLKIGYQYQPTQDIQITENGPGYLLRNKTVKISITDLISSDMWFTPDTKIQVTNGDLKLKNITTTGIDGFTSQSQSWLNNNYNSRTDAGITFDIERESTAASTITISNVSVKLDRTVPLTNKQSYQAIIWGTAVAENYGLMDYYGRTWKADFATAGEYANYINVISSPNDQSSILSQEVRVTIGENAYTVNGETYSMPAAAYISPTSHSTLVPLRFVAHAFGLRDENQILWDDTNKTATIFAPNRTIQFTLNKATMIVDGVTVTMFSPAPENLPVMAEIKGDRMYIPFRALGQAFGVPVAWNAETQTAIYNEGANTNVNSSITNDNQVSITPAPASPTPVPPQSATPVPTPSAPGQAS